MTSPISAGDTSGQESPGSVQRRRPRYHHHDHGLGTQSSSWRDLRGPPTSIPDLSELRPQFYLRGDLLEQSPSLAPYLPPRHRQRALGQSPSTLLAFAPSVCYWLDGREPLCRAAIRRLRRSPSG